MSDIIERLVDCPCNTSGHAMDEIERLRGEVAAWREKAATWMASPEAAQRLEGYREMGRKLAAMEAERDAAVKLLREVSEKFIYKGRGSTHWEGCEEFHPECAMAQRIETLIDAAKGEA